MDNNLKRAIILDNYEHPYNRGLVTNEDYDNINANNESCIDNFDMDIKIENNIIKDMHFDGEGCAISTSSTSIMLQMFIGKTKEECLSIIKEYENMIDEKKVIKKLQKRIDIFVKEHPELNNSESVESIREFIHLLEIEAKEQSLRKE